MAGRHVRGGALGPAVAAGPARRAARHLGARAGGCRAAAEAAAAAHAAHPLLPVAGGHGADPAPGPRAPGGHARHRPPRTRAGLAAGLSAPVRHRAGPDQRLHRPPHRLLLPAVPAASGAAGAGRPGARGVPARPAQRARRGGARRPAFPSRQGRRRPAAELQGRAAAGPERRPRGGAVHAAAAARRQDLARGRPGLRQRPQVALARPAGGRQRGRPAGRAAVRRRPWQHRGHARPGGGDAAPAAAGRASRDRPEAASGVARRVVGQSAAGCAQGPVEGFVAQRARSALRLLDARWRRRRAGRPAAAPAPAPPCRGGTGRAGRARVGHRHAAVPDVPGRTRWLPAARAGLFQVRQRPLRAEPHARRWLAACRAHPGQSSRAGSGWRDGGCRRSATDDLPAPRGPGHRRLRPRRAWHAMADPAAAAAPAGEPARAHPAAVAVAGGRAAGSRGAGAGARCARPGAAEQPRAARRVQGLRAFRAAAHDLLVPRLRRARSGVQEPGLADPAPAVGWTAARRRWFCAALQRLRP